MTPVDHAQNQNVLRVARDLYATYCASSSGKNYQGLPCPAWDALTEAVRGHWYTVARRVCSFVEVAEHTGPDAPFDMALATAPDELTIGHLTDPDVALATWRSYSGIEAVSS
jgi:hypothetical protein